MRVGIIQSNYIPWRGYFDFIDDVDLFVFHDDLQYTKGDWRNRNRIKTAEGTQWLTVPVHYRRSSQLINETAIDYGQDWAGRHLRHLAEAYRKAPFFNDHAEELAALLTTRWPTISALNQALVRWTMGKLGVNTPLLDSTQLAVQGIKTDRIIAIMRATGGRIYLSGPSARSYLDTAALAAAGVSLEYKVYDYAEYPQRWGAFRGDVTALDLLFNLGPDARRHMKSRTPNQPAALPASHLPGMSATPPVPRASVP